MASTWGSAIRSEPSIPWWALLIGLPLLLAAADPALAATQGTKSQLRTAPGVAGQSELNRRMAAFLRAQLGAPLPPPRRLWLKGELRNRVTALLGHPYPQLLLRYWQKGDQTVWRLEEIGKELPITVAIHVRAGKIQRLAILAYRESRGGEVQRPAFTAQYQGSALAQRGPRGYALDRPIDGISGATLSVRAVTRLARLALLLHAHVTEPPGDPAPP